MSERSVRVYSTALCAPCEALKADLRARGVDFTVFDPMMDEDAADFLEDRNIRTTPVMVVGEEIHVGYDPAQVAAIFDSR